MTTSASARADLHSRALNDMASSRPKRLVRALEYQAEDMDADVVKFASEADFRNALETDDDDLIGVWTQKLTAWDFAPAPTWTKSGKRTVERRAALYDALELEPETRTLLDSQCPISMTQGPIVISTNFTPWYQGNKFHGRPWYWPAYEQLLSDKGWPQTAVQGIDEATTHVVERLSSPTNQDPYQSKGLVVGYVQSGKTANFTGVISKAIDAGYRLVIVLGGTLNALRGQTQRRLDMEMVGRENILRGADDDQSDYAGDPAWALNKFVQFGHLPSTLGAFDVIRLTTREGDYESLRQGITALEFEKRMPSLPLYSEQNLHNSNARLMVVKKNKTVLTKLVKDLKKIKTPLHEIPTLIIDDESDEASVNTANPNSAAAPDRTAINSLISQLLTLLPRSQYVGYTATPFANVFIDPSDTEDIFPRDFIISLPRPAGYMGAPDFHDLDRLSKQDEQTFANSNEKAHVRDIVAFDDLNDDVSLQRALDTFVLTAAIKLYREDEGGLDDGFFQHHTMLVHESMLNVDQREQLGQVTRLWWNSGYIGLKGRQRLEKLYDSDIKPVCDARSEGYKVPDSFSELERYIGPAVFRIGGDGEPVIVVNGDAELDTGTADFDRRQIWKILIGGQKLSRGFTVEGLTVSYFRRRAGSASALMQMGRWFGFREGYRDLVRLFVGRAEAIGTRQIDLYEAFAAICLDEEAFRSELTKYSELVDGMPQLIPAQIPPLVTQHLSWLKPASPNKMFNARLVEISSPGEWREPTAYPKSRAHLAANVAAWLPVLSRLSQEPQTFAHYFEKDGKTVCHRFDANTVVVTAKELMPVLEGLKWQFPSQFAPNLTYLRSISDGPSDRDTTDSEGSPDEDATNSEGSLGKVDEWLVIAPINRGRGSQKILVDGSDREMSYFQRDRRRGDLFGAISDPKHRAVPLVIAGSLTGSAATTDAEILAEASTRELVKDNRGVVVLYPVLESTVASKHITATSAGGPAVHMKPEDVVMTFSFVAPATARGSDGRKLRFTAVDSSQETTPIIDAV